MTTENELHNAGYHSHSPCHYLWEQWFQNKLLPQLMAVQDCNDLRNQPKLTEKLPSINIRQFEAGK